MSEETHPPPRPPVQFGLRLLLAAMFGLCIAFALVRWNPRAAWTVGGGTMAVCFFVAGVRSLSDARRVVLLTIFFVVFTAPFCDGFRTLGWVGSPGLPYAWMTYSVHRAGGFIVLVHWNNLAPTVAFAISAGAGLFVFGRAIVSRFPSVARLLSWRQALCLSVVAMAIGAPCPTEPESIGVFLGLAVQPLVILLVTWRGATFGGIGLACAIAVLSFSFGQRFADLFLMRYGGSPFRWDNEGTLPFFWLFYFVPSAAILVVRRIAARFLQRHRSARHAMSP